MAALLFAAAMPAAAGDSKKHRNKAHQQMDQGQSTPKPIEMSDVFNGGNSKGPSSSKQSSNAKPASGPGALIGGNSQAPSSSKPTSSNAPVFETFPPTNNPAGTSSNADYKKTEQSAQNRYSVDFGPVKEDSKAKPTSNLPGVRGQAGVTPDNHATPQNPDTFQSKYTEGGPTDRREPLPSTWSSRFTHGDPTSSSKSPSDTEDWHKKNKKKHHDGDQNQGSFHNNTYDGSPIVYHKPKPASNTKDSHKENKNPQGQKWLYLNLPKDETAKKKHQHHGDDQDQGNN